MTLFRSVVNYAAPLISIWDKPTSKWQQDFLYRGFKSLLGLRVNAKKEKLLALCLGKPFADFNKVEQQNAVAKMCNYTEEGSERRADILDFCETFTFELPESRNSQYVHQQQEVPLKGLLAKGLNYQVIWYLGQAFQMFGGRAVKCPCASGKNIT